jgi:hypothetical protein
MRAMTKIGGAAAIGVAMLVGFGLSAPPAQAGYTVTLEQVGSDVVATGSGTIDLAGLSFVMSGGTAAQIEPDAAVEGAGPAINTPIDIYSGVAGPSTFGSGGFTLANTGSGASVNILGRFGEIYVPAGYMSGGALPDSATYSNATFSSLGVAPGTYVWTWGTAAADDSFTLDVVTAVVPAPVIGQGLPAVLAVGAVLLGAGLLQRNQKRRSPGPQTA